MKRWEFTGGTKLHCGITLRRIRATMDFTLKCGLKVLKGENGGWIEKERNLSGDAWASDNALVYDNARVYDDAWVSGDARVYENAMVYGDACVNNNARVYGNAQVYDTAIVFGSAHIYGNAWVSGYARISGDARVYDDGWVLGHAFVNGYARVFGNAQVYCDACVFGEAQVYDNAKVCGSARVFGNACIFGNARVFGSACISRDAKVQKLGDVIWFENIWSSGRVFTYTKSNNKWDVGCFYGTGEELIKKAYKDSELSGKCYEATVKYVEQIYAAIDASKEAN